MFSCLHLEPLKAVAEPSTEGHFLAEGACGVVHHWGHGDSVDEEGAGPVLLWAKRLVMFQL